MPDGGFYVGCLGIFGQRCDSIDAWLDELHNPLCRAGEFSRLDHGLVVVIIGEPHEGGDDLTQSRHHVLDIGGQVRSRDIFGERNNGVNAWPDQIENARHDAGKLVSLAQILLANGENEPLEHIHHRSAESGHIRRPCGQVRHLAVANAQVKERIERVDQRSRCGGDKPVDLRRLLLDAFSRDVHGPGCHSQEIGDLLHGGLSALGHLDIG